MNPLTRVITISCMLSLLLMANDCTSCLVQRARASGAEVGKGRPQDFDARANERQLRQQFSDLAAAVNDGDRVNALREIKRTDVNGDGVVTEDEWSESGYQAVERFRLNDLNGDKVLTPFEHSLRWAQARTRAQPTQLQQRATDPAAKIEAPGSSSNREVDRPKTPGFEIKTSRVPVPGFGEAATPASTPAEIALKRQFPELAAAVNDADRANALREIKRTDLNTDGVVTEAEWTESGYQPVERFQLNDLNEDKVLTLFEHSMRWAQARTGAQITKRQERIARQPSQNGQAPQPTGAKTPQSQPHKSDKQLSELAVLTLSVYDRNRSGVIERNEYRSPNSAFGNVRGADADVNGQVDHNELAVWLAKRLSKQRSGKQRESVPEWFLTSDVDGDGQVQMAEFLSSGSANTIEEFERYDANDDGFVTTTDLSSLRRVKAAGKPAPHCSSSIAHVIEAEGELVDFLTVTEEFIVRDVNVQLAVLKKGDDDLELTLIGPDGTQALLYSDSRTKPWGGGPLFEDTLIDDEATLGQRLPQPPHDRTFPSQGSSRKDTRGLKALYGKPARGRWRLVIRNKSQNAGILEGWALAFTPQK